MKGTSDEQGRVASAEINPNNEGRTGTGALQRGGIATPKSNAMSSGGGITKPKSKSKLQ